MALDFAIGERSIEQVGAVGDGSVLEELLGAQVLRRGRGDRGGEGEALQLASLSADQPAARRGDGHQEDSSQMLRAQKRRWQTQNGELEGSLPLPTVRS